MVRRIVDLAVSVLLLVVISPLLLVAAIGIRWSSPGPILYRARRIGRHGRVFTMFKLRTMHVRSEAGSSITAANDPRVFTMGRLLRATKIDELPQLLNIVRGEMSIVGPRPEAPDIVAKYYSATDMLSLDVPPGLTSPGSLFYYTHGEQLLADGEAEHYYVSRLLPLKMRLDLAYLETASPVSDLLVVVRTAWVLLQKVAGRTQFPVPALLRASAASGIMTAVNPDPGSRQRAA